MTSNYVSYVTLESKMPDNPTQSSEQSSREGGAGQRSEEQTNEQTGGETATKKSQKAKKTKTPNAGAAQTEENAGEGEEKEQDEEETKPEEKPHIPDDFYYEVEELWRKPHKSDETLPDDLVTLYHSFGYPCRMRNNLHAIGVDRLIFAAGGYLQIVVMGNSGYKYDFLTTTGGGSVGALAVHPQGKLFAVGEKGPTPVVNIFTVAEYKLYRILRAGTTVSFTAIAFNEQGDLLASQGGEPDYMLTVWNWQQESILLRCKSFSQEVNHVSFNRDLQGALTSAGIGHIKFWNMARTFTGLKLQGSVGRFGRTALSDIEGYIEFPDGKVLSGSDWGNILLWDENLIKLQIGRKNGKFCHTGKIMHMMIVEGEIISAGMDGFVRSWNLELIDMLEAGEESGLVEIEPMNEVLIGPGAQLYYLTQPPFGFKKEIAKKGVEESEIGDAAESGDEHSSNSTWYCQDGAGGIWKADLSFRNAAAPPKRILHFHAGAIVACAVSPVTHLVMTLGEDGTLRLYDFLKKKLLAVRQFKAQGSSLVWIPLCVDNKCATVMAGFADGGIRRVAIDGSTTTVFGKDSMECQLKLMQALKPHDQPVTCLAYSIKSATDGMSFLVTCSVDKTLFFFDVLGEKYVPLCFVTVLHVPRHAYCSPDQATQDHVMVTCDDGFVIEMIHPVLVDQTETLQYDKVKMRSYQFASVKSKILHDEELANADEIEKKRQEERDEDNKMLLVQGVETPSQQELRVMVEDENAAKEKIAKEESEDLWKPYIPPVPSPILQTVYLEGDSKFWLMLGEYDAGFLYECQFNQKFERYGDKPRPEQSGEKSDEKSDEKSADKFAEKTPLRTIKVVDAENNPITAMCFNSDGTCVFFGMQDGRIRLQFLESEFDLATERFHWSIGAHDVTHGPITGMKLSHDESFLITVGEDGNFFIFSLVPIEQLMDDMAAKGAKIPACAADEKADLTANQYTIEQAKQKSDYDHMLMVAERHKQDRRAEVACLRMAFKRVVAKNVALPLRHRLTPDEFVMDESRVQELKEENMLKVKDMRRQTAWDCEKARLSYEKMKTYYMEHLETHRFCVKAINTDHVIYSYRVVVKPIVTMSPRHSKVSLTEMGSADDDKATSDDEDALELKRLMGTPMTSETLLGLSKRTALLLKQVEEKRLNRAKRKMVWTHFFNTKPGDDFEDPADVAAIQEAYDTMGDRHLKSDSNYIVPDSYRLTMADGSARLEGCEQRLLTAQRELNTKLLELREEKINTIHEVQGMVDRLYEIHEALDHTKHQLIPRVPDLTLSEVPGGKFNMDRSDEMRLRMKVREEMKKRLGSVNLNQATSRRESMFSKSQRKSSVVIAKENFTRLKAMAHIDIDIASETELSVSNAFHPGLDALKEKEEMELTAMQRELREIHEIELIYEQSQIIKHIQETKQIFDIHHRQLRHEKFLLDVVVECSRLRVTTLQEEQMLLRECEHVEEEIHGRIERCLEQRVDIDKCVKSLQSQLVKQGRELEELAKKEKVLYQKLEAIMGEANNFHDYLVKVYKKKIKRKVARMLTDDDEESSESESDSSDESEAEEDDEDAMQHDLNMCPVGCDENNYNDVVALREHRLDLDEVVTEVKRLRDGVLKEVDNCVRKRQSTEVTYTKALQEFTAFQLEKQKRVNNLDVLCTIQLHQIQCVRRYGEFKSITDELLIDETEVIRLQKRISELKVEKNEQKKMTIQRRKLHVHLQHERRLFLNRLEEMNQLSEKEMRSKFGKVVDLEEVETVAADLHVEDVRSRLLRYQIGCDKELLQKKNQLKCLRKNNISSLRIDSEYKKLEAGLKARHVVLEHDLNEVLKKSNMAYEEDPPEISKEMEEMMDVVATQRGAIKALTLEIEYLQGREQPANIGHSSGSYA